MIHIDASKIYMCMHVDQRSVYVYMIYYLCGYGKENSIRVCI